MKVWAYILFAIAAAVFSAVQWIRGRRRSSVIRALAKKFGFSYLGKTLPGAVSLYGTPFNRYTSNATSNVIDGQRNGVRVIAFDCEVSEEKSSWSRTVIAAKTSADVFSTASSNPDLKIVGSGGWMILYYPPENNSPAHRGLMPVEEIEAHLNGIRR